MKNGSAIFTRRNNVCPSLRPVVDLISVMVRNSIAFYMMIATLQFGVVTVTVLVLEFCQTPFILYITVNYYFDCQNSSNDWSQYIAYLSN